MKMGFALLFFVICQCCQGQNKVTDTSATIYTYFKKGEKKVFHVAESSTQYTGLFVAMQASAVYEVTMEVLQDSAAFYTLDWTIKTMKTSDKKFAVYSLIANMRNGLKLQYKMNKKGMLTAFLNLPDVYKHLARAYDSLTTGQSYDDINRALINQLPTFMQTAGSILDVYLKPFLLYHTAYGGEWTLGKPYYKAHGANNAFGGDDVPTVVITELNKLKPREDFAQLYVDQIVNKELAAKILSGNIKEVTEDATGKSVKSSDLPEQIKMKDHNEFDVILSTGWVSRAFYERITKNGTSKKVDQIEITFN